MLNLKNPKVKVILPQKAIKRSKRLDNNNNKNSKPKKSLQTGQIGST